MVNNAGIGGTEMHEIIAEDTCDAVIAMDSRSVFLGCKCPWPQSMIQSPLPSGHRGWIINISSIIGLVGQEVHGGKSDKPSEIAYIADILLTSGILCLKRSSDDSYEADCRGIYKVQDLLQ